MKITMKFYFDDGSEIEEDVLSSDVLDPSDPEDVVFDQSIIKESAVDVPLAGFLDLDSFFAWLKDPDSLPFDLDFFENPNEYLTSIKRNVG